MTFAIFISAGKIPEFKDPLKIYAKGTQIKSMTFSIITMLCSLQSIDFLLLINNDNNND